MRMSWQRGLQRPGHVHVVRAMKTAQSRALMRGFLQSLFPALWLGVSPNSLHAANGAPPQVTARPGVAIVDDSATVVLDATPLMSWRTVTPKGRDNAIVGRTRVNARLTTTLGWERPAKSTWFCLPTPPARQELPAWPRNVDGWPVDARRARPRLLRLDPGKAHGRRAGRSDRSRWCALETRSNCAFISKSTWVENA